MASYCSVLVYASEDTRVYSINVDGDLVEWKTTDWNVPSGGNVVLTAGGQPNSPVAALSTTDGSGGFKIRVYYLSNSGVLCEAGYDTGSGGWYVGKLKGQHYVATGLEYAVAQDSALRVGYMAQGQPDVQEAVYIVSSGSWETIPVIIPVQ